MRVSVLDYLMASLMEFLMDSMLEMMMDAVLGHGSGQMMGYQLEPRLDTLMVQEMGLTMEYMMGI